jgi:hypothetical protein
MVKYKVIRKCFWDNKKWNVGDIVELDKEPPYHFTKASSSEQVNRLINVVPVSQMKSRAKEVNTYYDMAIATESREKSAGFANNISSNKSVFNQKDFKSSRSSK